MTHLLSLSLSLSAEPPMQSAAALLFILRGAAAGLSGNFTAPKSYLGKPRLRPPERARAPAAAGAVLSSPCYF